MKHLIVILAAAAVSGCANWGYNPSYRFNEVQAVNLTGAAISEVRVAVVGTEKSVSCDSVNPFAMCQDYFNSTRYPVMGVELSWTQADGKRFSVTESPHIPVYFSPVFPLRIVMEIGADGSVKSFYEQEEPGDGPFMSDSSSLGTVEEA